MPGSIAILYSAAPKTAAAGGWNSLSDSVLAVFRQLTTPRKFNPVVINGNKFAHRFSQKSVTSLRKLHLQTGIKALQKSGNSKAALRFTAMLEEESSCDNENIPASDKDIKIFLTLKKEIKDTLTFYLKQQYGWCTRKARGEAKTLLQSISKDTLNNGRWDIIQDSFSFAGQTFDSMLTPAGQLKLGEKDIFATGYDNKGVCSKSTDETTHAVNFWVSRFAERGNGKPLFTGIRHAVLSPFGLKAGSAERRQGALNRAKEVAVAALMLQPVKLAAALAGETVTLPLTSTGLLTPIDIGPCTEKSQLWDQMSAWNALNAGPVELAIRDDKGNVVPVNVRLDIAAFNFGVNELALGRLKLGHAFSDKYNQLALTKLLGRDLGQSSEHGGWVGQYLASRPANAERVSSLASELKQIWANKSHHDDNGEPYKAARRVALLSNEIGITPCWNCKSGKDRTGIMDVVIKHDLASQYLHKIGANSGANDGEKKLMQAVMLNSGNMQVQQYNTGAAGNKSLKNNNFINFFLGKSTLRSNVGEEVADAAKGLSDLV